MPTFIVTTSYPADEDDPSGHFVRSDARRLVSDGQSVVVLCPGTERARFARRPLRGADGIEVIRLGGNDTFGWPGFSARLREKPSRALGAAEFMLRASRFVRREANTPSSTLVGHWALPAIAPIALAAPRARAVAVSHGGDVRLLLALPFAVRERLVRTIAHRVSEWRFVSASLRAELEARVSPRSRRAIHTVATIGPSAIEAIRVTQAPESFEFATVARLVRSKRVDHVLRHVARLSVAPPRADGERTPTLVVVGDGPERQALERLASDLGVRAHFVGRVPRSEALGWIRSANVLLHASRSEGASTVLREAELLGVRVELVP